MSNKAKEFLERYRTADRKIQMLADEIDKIESLAGGRAVSIDGQPHGNGTTDKVAIAATAAADLQEKLSAWLFEQEKTKREMSETWFSIACVMNLSERQVQRIHGRALQEVQKIIDRKGETKCD